MQQHQMPNSTQPITEVHNLCTGLNSGCKCISCSKASSISSVLSTEMIAVKPIEARFKLLQNLNRCLVSLIAFVDLCMVDKSWSVAALLTSCRELIFEAVKLPVWENAMSSTNSSGSQFELQLNRQRAAKQMRSGLPDHDGRMMAFSQAFRQMHILPPASLRRTDRLYSTKLLGEQAIDAGGPYRDSFATYASELQSCALPLLIRNPNGKMEGGNNREKWILNPGAMSSTHFEMFAFFGKLMGIAIRSKEYLALNISSMIWKLLVNDTPTREDLEGVDSFFLQSLESIRNCEKQGISIENFSDVFPFTFTVTTSDERIVELVPGGALKEVTFESRLEYCERIENYRMNEFNSQAAAVRRGLACMIPSRLLSLFTWEQLERMVCGDPFIDLELLKSNTVCNFIILCSLLS